MSLKVKAVERLLKFTNNENDHGVYRYVMKPELYAELMPSLTPGPSPIGEGSENQGGSETPETPGTGGNDAGENGSGD